MSQLDAETTNVAVFGVLFFGKDIERKGVYTMNLFTRLMVLF